MQPWPNNAACESAITATIGVPSGTSGTPLVVPKPWSEATAAGKVGAGRPKISSRSAFQSSAVMSYSSVREALPASQRCSAPPVSCQTNQESTVPSRTSSIGTPLRAVVEQPPHLGRREHRVDPQTCTGAHQLPILVGQ